MEHSLFGKIKNAAILGTVSPLIGRYTAATCAAIILGKGYTMNVALESATAIATKTMVVGYFPFRDDILLRARAAAVSIFAAFMFDPDCDVDAAISKARQIEAHFNLGRN